MQGSSINYPFEGNGYVLYKSKSILIEKEVSIRPRSYLSIFEGASFKIGQGTNVGSDFVVSCIHEVEIGRNVLIADRCFIGDSNHDYNDINIPIKMGEMVPGSVKIGDDCWLGINVAVLRNVTIGRHCGIGANSVVTKDIPPYCIAAGNPARIIKQYDLEKAKWVSC